MAEPIQMLFVLDGAHIGATLRIRLNCLCSREPHIKLLWPLV